MSEIKIAFPTDEHYPYQDDYARSVALQIVKDFDPNVLITGSDGLDFYSISHFDKDPYLKGDPRLGHEINQWLKGQREWSDAAPNAEKKFLVGNHEDRLTKYFFRNPELADLEVLKLSSILRFDSIGIKDEPGYEYSFYDKLLYRHGDVVRQYSAYSAKAELETQRYSISVIHGHTHRGGSYYTRTRAGLVQAYEGFCLCDLNPHYNRTKRLMDWHHGIVLATVSPSGVFVEPVPFFGNAGGKYARWRGEEYFA